MEEISRCYNEENKLGEGGFGRVYLGTLRHTQVAVKCLTQVVYYTTTFTRAWGSGDVHSLR